MASDPNPTSIRILDKEYVVSCPPGEEEALTASADYLSKRMREARESGSVLGSERIAVMTALNITHDYLQLLKKNEMESSSVSEEIRRLCDRVSGSLGRRED